jgi:ABC-type antimicrobial peptide transport system permease subunit
MVGIVTMFTLAHSITLAAAGLRLVTVPPSVVEPAIALTIVIAALDSLYPLLRGRHKLFAFMFGLIHGFGFAGVLSELALPAGGLVQALLAFNLGVEAGQLVIVGCVLALLLALRWWQRYPVVVLKGGSVAAISIASVWFVERAFDARLMTF